MNNYDDIIDLPHHEPNIKHPRMSIYKRSAQFAPFAALTGYEDFVEEKGRITNKRIILDDNVKNKINDTLNELIDSNNKLFKVNYFVKDKYKSGGKYITTIEELKKVDRLNKLLICNNKKIIPIDDIIEIDLLK